MKKTSISLVVAVNWFLLVTFLLCLPGTAFPKETWFTKIQFDKWIHIFLFFILVVLWCSVFQTNRSKEYRRKIFTWLALAALLYGSVMEIIQHFFVSHRSFEAGDIIADGLGALGGYFYAIKKMF